jgi:hypothetical protein
MLPARKGLDPKKPADTDEAEISQCVGGSDINLHVIYVPEEQAKPIEIEPRVDWKFDVAQTYNAEGLMAIHPSESEVNHGMFVNDCYVQFPALA